MKVVARKLAELHMPEKNVRKHNDKQIGEYIRSIKMFGQIKPLVIAEDGEILAGNGLFMALQRMGAESCDCYVMTGLTPAQRRKVMLADNRVYELGMTDIGVFDEIIRELGEDTDVPGWDEDLLQMITATAADADEMIASYGVYTPQEVQRTADRQREDPQAYVPPSAPSAAADGVSGTTQPGEAAVDSPDAQPPSGAAETLSGRYIICPHCGARIELPGEGGE